MMMDLGSGAHLYLIWGSGMLFVVVIGGIMAGLLGVGAGIAIGPGLNLSGPKGGGIKHAGAKWPGKIP